MTGKGARGVNVVLPGKGEEVAIPGFGATYKLHAGDTGGEVAIVEHPFAVGFISAPHKHAGEDEHSFVLEGEIGFRSDDSEVVLGPGSYITKPRGQMHAMWNAGDVPGRIIEIITPGGFEDYFRQLGELLVDGKKPEPTAGSLHDTDEFTALATRFGLTYGEPDWLDDVINRYGLRRPTH
ncbi:cupin domain-containing protein [Streptomyces sp. NBC_01190]|uniref:cupin domain-containing protein n=1 Tax=Streptomyces sp. NBC_01190 TaxID=2903767 RepID=UPI00386E4F30|nr:cupin domain-containing protein [Streptomyces sp. NBC_01190]